MTHRLRTWRARIRAFAGVAEAARIILPAAMREMISIAIGRFEIVASSTFLGNHSRAVSTRSHSDESHSMSTAPKREPIASESESRSIYLISYPKIVFMYPTLIFALIAGTYLSLFGEGTPPKAAPKPVAVAEKGTPAGKSVPADKAAAPAAKPAENQFEKDFSHPIHLLFLGVFTLNLIVFAFDFPRGTSLGLFFFLAAAAFGLLLLFRFNEDILPFVNRVLSSYHPRANATFYFSIAGVLTLIFAGVFVDVHLDYWEVTPNELLHHHGMLSDLERMSSPQLKVDKEINDLFEYMLLGSGRLVLHPGNNERHAIVLDNVLGIKKKEAELTRMLGALQVEFRPAQPPRS